jgi:hypothetical protein
VSGGEDPAVSGPDHDRTASRTAPALAHQARNQPDSLPQSKDLHARVVE